MVSRLVQILKEMKECKDSDDYQLSHQKADELLAQCVELFAITEPETQNLVTEILIEYGSVEKYYG